MPSVNQPFDVSFNTADGSVRLEWRKDFSAVWSGRCADAQNALAQGVLELCEPYIPKRTGYLISTGRADGENGDVTWTAPYVGAQYYLPNRRKVDGVRGSFWFERMYEANKEKVVALAKEAFQE